MKFSIQHDDSPTLARMKLIYLIPAFIVFAIPIALYVGFMENTIMGVRDIINVIRTGRP
jgi:hypothetical protein